ncbi:18.5 kDa class I heat shock protein-like [Trifolium medium]|uniref:18.5 kDa class I heat shock protein-like n=1 Tax=Trifolium medium TaxID=97028 RepID=A0A392PAN7_9FABA|nr:18.5 kDa class I heat shock protein-like [Trifolium medium]
MNFHFALPSPISNFFAQFNFGSSLSTRLDRRETPISHVWKVVLLGFNNKDVLVELSRGNNTAGYRTLYLSHAKRALYHLSYIPMLINFST